MLLLNLRDLGHVGEEALAWIQPAEEGLKGPRHRHRSLQVRRGRLEGSNPLPSGGFLLLDSDHLGTGRGQGALELRLFVSELLDILATRLALRVERGEADMDDALFHHLREDTGPLPLRDAGQLQGRGEARALIGIVPQPVQQLGEAPFRREHAAAEFDGGKVTAPRDRSASIAETWAAMAARARRTYASGSRRRNASASSSVIPFGT